MKTKFNSFCEKDMCKGCKLCLKGEKLVLFMGGKCSRNCWYCSLSDGRKNSKIIWANERPCSSIKDIIEEAKESNAKGAGITGGDPLVYLNKTISAAKALKIQFGKKFHIHIYLPLPLVDKSKLEKLKPYIDEIRFHPSFLTDPNKKLEKEELEKIKLASSIFGKQNIGIELPLLPDKKNKIISFVEKISPKISFANFNEFELSDTNFQKTTKNYTLNSDTYTISKSIETGKEILKRLKKTKLKLHLCTASTKNHYQYHNRLLKHKIMPYGIKTKEATVVYFTIEPKNIKETINKLKKHTKNFHIDKTRNRILLKEQDAKNLYEKFEIYLSEEHPTFDAEKMSY